MRQSVSESWALTQFFTFQTDIPTPQCARTPTPPTVWYRERIKSLSNCAKVLKCQSPPLSYSTQDKRKNWKLQVPTARKDRNLQRIEKMFFSHENKITLHFHKKNPKPEQWSNWQNLNPNHQNKIFNSNSYLQVLPCLPRSCFWSSISALDGKRRESNA